MFATNISGRELKKAWSRSMSWVILRASISCSSLLLEDPDVMVIGAQFMYISRLPILLNQVHAMTAVPVGRSVGTVKGNESGFTRAALSAPLLPATPLIGHPPSIEWMTFHVLLAVGALSYEMDTWHEPPP
jgi:hypothetical protein